VRILVSTFSDGDDDKVLLAMRRLPYDELVLVGPEDDGPSMSRLRKLEELSGRELEFREILPGSFMDMVDSISEVLAAARTDRGERNEVLLNISGGSKIMGDAALFAAFRLGVEAYHCDRVVVKLPVLKGATAKDRFTEQQVSVMDLLFGADVPFTEVIEGMGRDNRSSTERSIRELKKMRLILARPEDGKVLLGLSPEGREVARATRFARGM